MTSLEKIQIPARISVDNKAGMVKIMPYPTRNTQQKDATMTARQKMIAKVESLSTEMLLDIARTLNLKTDTESMLVSTFVERELCNRLDEAAFIELMNEFDAELSAA